MRGCRRFSIERTYRVATIRGEPLSVRAPETLRTLQSTASGTVQSGCQSVVTIVELNKVECECSGRVTREPRVDNSVRSGGSQEIRSTLHLDHVAAHH